MAGNIVKWWRHKILGGYKHFSGFHECPTDTEELIYPIRAPSSCSAPPDLLLTSDREQIHIRCPTPQSHQHHHNHHHQNSKNEKNHHYHINQVQTTTSPHMNQETEKDLTQIASKKLDKKNLSKTPVTVNTTINGSSNVNNNNNCPDRVHLEEFTCDVSVEGGGKTPQPLQFSFTLYDLDGHGKITKDDIAGIVSTIYESIGKTVVVPHYGSKTINVRLTVSPDGKKVKERERTTSCTKKGVITPRRRVRQRKLISDDDGSDTSNDCVERRRNTSQSIAARNNISGNGRNSNVCAATTKENINRISKDCSTTTGTTTTTTESTNSNKQPQLTAAAAASATSAVTQVQQVILNEHQSQNIYDSTQNLKFYSNQKSASMVQQQQQQQANDTNSTNVINLHIKENNEISCQDCKFDNVVVAHKYNLRKKLLRKSRSRHKQQQHKITNINNINNNNNNNINADQIDKPEPRVRSLSVGNENCYNHIDDDGNDENFWKSSLRRHELFEIIRESMEKNRLCFQANRKPVPDTSPSNFHRHRHRSHTITKMIDENNLAVNDQTAINHPLPETNLCGYDSFLHATICANGNNNVASPNTVSTPVRISGGHLHQNSSNSNNHIINNNLSSSANNKKALKLKNHHHHHHHNTSTSNTPAGNVYTRLNTATSNEAGHKLNTTILSQLNPNLTSEQKFNRTINHVEKWLTDRTDHQIPVPSTDISNNIINNNNINSKQHKSKLVRSKSKEEINLLKDVTPPKKVENLICFDKLKITEDTISSIGSCVGGGNAKKLTSSKLQHQQQQHQHHHVHNSPVKSIGGNSAGGESVNKTKTGLIMEYASIPVNAEPSECENLLRCSDEDTNNPASSSVTPSTVHRYVHEHIHHHYHHFENDET